MLNQACVRGILSCVLIFAFITASGGAVAEADSLPTMTLGSVYNAQSGNAVEVPVSISDMPDLAMVQFCIRYDSEKLTYSGFRAGEMLVGQGAPTINSRNAGKLYFVWDSTEVLPDSGCLGTFLFQTKDTAGGSADICIDTEEDIVFADSTFDVLTPTFVSGKIVIFNFCLPVGLTEISEEAFAGSDVRFVRLSENIERIGPRAFADCSNLSCIVIPSNAEINSTAFNGVTDLIIIGKTGTTAEAIASANHFEFIALP